MHGQFAPGCAVGLPSEQKHHLCCEKKHRRHGFRNPGGLKRAEDGLHPDCDRSSRQTSPDPARERAFHRQNGAIFGKIRAVFGGLVVACHDMLLSFSMLSKSR